MILEHNPKDLHSTAVAAKQLAQSTGLNQYVVEVANKHIGSVYEIVSEYGIHYQDQNQIKQKLVP